MSLPPQKQKSLFLFMTLLLILVGVCVASEPQGGQAALLATSFRYPIDNGYSWIERYDIQNEGLENKWIDCFQQYWPKLYHAGEDWGKATGTSVKAIANGRVVWAGQWSPGKAVIVEHTLSDGSIVYSMYAHLESQLSVDIGQDVTIGSEIGKLYYQTLFGKDNTHLHWEVRSFYDGSFVCNDTLIPGRGYTYPNRPDSFPNHLSKRYYSPSVYVSESAKRNVSVALLIDASGSMGTNDGDGMRRAAAKVFIDNTQIGDKITVISFNAQAYKLAALRTIQSDADRIFLKAAVDQVGQIGGTNLNAALDLGFSELLSDTSSNFKAAVLLTDGIQESGGPYNPQSHLQYQNKFWPLYTVGFGEANMTLLEQIATDTNAKCVNNCLPLEDPEMLQVVYFELSERVNGGKITLSTSVALNQGESKTLFTDVSSNQMAATFFIAWPGSEVSMKLRSPGGMLIDALTIDPHVYHSKGSTYEIYTIRFPQSGEWIIELYGTSLPIGGEVVDVRVSTKTAMGNFPGDLDGDGDVDIYDYNQLVTDFGKVGDPGFIPADININGSVDIFDFNILVSNFGHSESSASTSPANANIGTSLLSVPNPPSNGSFVFSNNSINTATIIRFNWEDNADDEDGFSFNWEIEDYDGSVVATLANPPTDTNLRPDTTSAVLAVIPCVSVNKVYTINASVSAFNGSGVSAATPASSILSIPACNSVFLPVIIKK